MLSWPRVSSLLASVQLAVPGLQAPPSSLAYRGAPNLLTALLLGLSVSPPMPGWQPVTPHFLREQACTVASCHQKPRLSVLSLCFLHTSLPYLGLLSIRGLMCRPYRMHSCSALHTYTYACVHPYKQMCRLAYPPVLSASKDKLHFRVQRNPSG